MLTTKYDSIASILTEEAVAVVTYFRHLNKAEATPEILAQRIAAELPVKLNALCHAFGVTTLSYLDADARESISTWQPQNKNRFYEVELSAKIDHVMVATSFSLQSYVAFRHSIFAAILAATGIALFLAPAPDVNLSVMKLPAEAIKLLAFAMVAGISYFAVPKMTGNREKAHILNQLEDYLNSVQLELNKQVLVIKDVYCTEFDSLAASLGEK